MQVQNSSIIFTQSNWNEFFSSFFLLLLSRWNYFQWAVNRVLNIYLFIFCCCRFVLLTIVILIESRLWHWIRDARLCKKARLSDLFISHVLSCVSFHNLQINWVIQFLSLFVTVFFNAICSSATRAKMPKCAHGENILSDYHHECVLFFVDCIEKARKKWANVSIPSCGVPIKRPF